MIISAREPHGLKRKQVRQNRTVVGDSKNYRRLVMGIRIVCVKEQPSMCHLLPHAPASPGRKLTVGRSVDANLAPARTQFPDLVE